MLLVQAIAVSMFVDEMTGYKLIVCKMTLYKMNVDKECLFETYVGKITIDKLKDVNWLDEISVDEIDDWRYILGLTTWFQTI